MIKPVSKTHPSSSMFFILVWWWYAPSWAEVICVVDIYQKIINDQSCLYSRYLRIIQSQGGLVENVLVSGLHWHTLMTQERNKYIESWTVPAEFLHISFSNSFVSLRKILFLFQMKRNVSAMRIYTAEADPFIFCCIL